MLFQSTDKADTITIASLTVPGTNIARDGLLDCVMQPEYLAPGEHHSISSGLFASLLGKDLDVVRDWAATGETAAMIQWGFGSGTPPRFKTRFVITQDSGPYIRFTSGLETERRLDAYTRKLENPSSRQTSGTLTPSAEDASRHGQDTRRGWDLSSDQGHISGLETHRETTGLGPHRDSISSEAQDFPFILRGSCDNQCLPVGLSSSTRRTSQSQSGSPPTGQNPTPIATPPPLDISSDDEQPVDIAVNQQVLNETLERNWLDAVDIFHQTGDMTAARRFLPPSMDGARTVGPTGSPWVWNSEFHRWYWIDRNGQQWWS